MTKKIKNLSSIQVFRIVANSSNVSLAAKEMSISQSSVSYHIKKLETDLDVGLFNRNGRGLELTKAGEELFKHVETGLDIISDGLAKVTNDQHTVKIAMLPLFASRWLSGRLSKFVDINPKLQLTLKSHNNTYATMENPERYAHFGIQWGVNDWKDVCATKLWDEKLTVVCSPSYLTEYSILKPADIINCTILHVDNNRMWDEWLNMHNLKLSEIKNQMMLEDRHFQLSSTINGLGVSLFAHWAVESELKSGQLVNPFGMNFETAFAYHLVVPKNTRLSKEAKRFHDWLINFQYSTEVMKT